MSFVVGPFLGGLQSPPQYIVDRHVLVLYLGSQINSRSTTGEGPAM